MSLLVVVLLAGCAAVQAKDGRMYATEGSSAAAAPLRQEKNERDIRASNGGIREEDCQAKLEAMHVSPFTFYRGSNLLYYRDLDSQRTIFKSAFYDAKATPWIQGDMHVLNAGRFDNGRGTVVFDLNDFDESFVANYLYDVYRMAASIVLVARNNSMPDSDGTTAIETFAEAYRDQLKKLSEDSRPNPFTFDRDHASGMIRQLLSDKDETGELGGRKDQKRMRAKMLDKWTTAAKKGRRFLANDELAAVADKDRADIERALEDYYKDTVTSSLRGDSEYFRVLDVAHRKNAGTGSLGTPRYYVLIEGASSDPDDARILDLKLQGKPAVYRYLTRAQQAAVDDNVANDADRAVLAYRSLVSKADEHLGYVKLWDGYYSVRERSPYKKSLELTSNLNKKALLDLADQWGVMLANAHARSSKGNEALGVPTSFEDVVTDLTRGRRRDFAEEISEVALAYAKQVEHDYSLFSDSYLGDGVSVGTTRLCAS